MFDAYDLFKSIDVIVDSRLQALQLDRTLICKITHDANKNYGQYEVTHNSTRFTAYTEKTDYVIGDTVYVGVPENNYNNAYIISKKLAEADIDNHANPFEDFVQMVEYKNSTKQTIVSGTTINENLLTSPLLSQDITDIESYANLGLSFQISSQLPDDFKFGFIVQVITQEKLNEEGATYPKNHLFTFSCDEMIGKATRFLGEFAQKKLIDIQTLHNISRVNVYLDVDTGAIPLDNESYLYFKDINVSFGYLKSNYNEDSVYIYTNGSMVYTYDENKPQPIRDIYIRWLYTDGLGRLIAITPKNSDKLPDNAKIKWYQMEAGEWKDLNNDNLLSYQLTPNKYRATEQLKCIISHEVFGRDIPVEYESNILELHNGTPGFGDVIEGESFTLSPDKIDFSGSYNMDGSIADYALADVERAFKASFTVSDKVWGDDVISIRVKWTVPSTNTMIMIKDKGFESKGSQQQKIEVVNINPDTLTATNGLIERSFIYSIKDYYSPLDKNNTVGCEIQVIQNNNQEILQTDYAEAILDFKRPGVCEKDNVLMLSMYDEEGNRVRCIKPDQKVTVSAKLYDNNGAQVTIVTPIQWSWYSPEDIENTFLTFDSTGNDSCIVTAEPTIPTSSTDINYSAYSYILQGSYVVESSLGKKEVIGLLPMAINLSTSLKYLSGPIQIVYSSSGGNPTYYKNSYKMYLQNGNVMRNVLYDVYSPGTYDNPSGKNNPLYPVIGLIDDEAWLCPKSSYIKDADKGCAITVTSNGLLYWIQPILMYQTNSFSSFINEWDGKMKIDEENNVAMMARLGAGKKNEDGSYSGVLLGDWVPEIEDDSWSGTGLFGYDHGKASYGFREDGTAFIGKSGSGRINFNGNEGLIYSDNFNGTVYGIKEMAILRDKEWLTDEELILTNSGTASIIGYNNFANTSLTEIAIGSADTDRIILTTPGDSHSASFKIQNVGDDINNWDKTMRPGETFVLTEEIEILDAKRGRKDDSGTTVAYDQELKFDSKDTLSYLQIDVSSYSYKTKNYVTTTTETGDVTNVETSGTEYDSFWQEDLGSFDVVRTGARIRIKKRFTVPGEAEFTGTGEDEGEEENSNIITKSYLKEITIPLFKCSLMAGKDNLDPEIEGMDIAFRYKIKDVKLYHVPVLDASQSLQSNGDIEYDRLLVFDQGTQGTFINLSEGDLVTNTGTFRGTVQAENLEVLKEVTIGDLASGNYLTLGPNGVSIAPTVIIKSISGGGGGNLDPDKVINLTIPGQLELGTAGSLGTNFQKEIQRIANTTTEKWGDYDILSADIFRLPRYNGGNTNTDYVLMNLHNEYPVNFNTKVHIKELAVDIFDATDLGLSADNIEAIKGFHFQATEGVDVSDRQIGVSVHDGETLQFYSKGTKFYDMNSWTSTPSGNVYVGTLYSDNGFAVGTDHGDPCRIIWSFNSTTIHAGGKPDTHLTFYTYDAITGDQIAEYKVPLWTNG